MINTGRASADRIDDEPGEGTGMVTGMSKKSWRIRGWAVCVLLGLAAQFLVLFSACTAQEPQETNPAPPAAAQEQADEADKDVEAEVARVMDSLEGALSDALDSCHGNWAVYIEDVETGYSAKGEHGAACGDSMVAASIVKIFIMACVYEKIEQKVFTEDDVYPDVYEMITVSDNEATNRLIAALGSGDAAAGMAAVNTYARAIGCEKIALHRLMLEENGKQNYVSALDCARLLRLLQEGRCVSRAASDKMLEILKAQEGKDYIPQGLPAGTEIAHKGGDLLGLCQGDVGIVYANEGAYIECIICNEPESYVGCMDEIVAISALVSSYMEKRPARA